MNLILLINIELFVFITFYFHILTMYEVMYFHRIMKIPWYNFQHSVCRCEMNHYNYLIYKNNLKPWKTIWIQSKKQQDFLLFVPLTEKYVGGWFLLCSICEWKFIITFFIMLLEYRKKLFYLYYCVFFCKRG